MTVETIKKEMLTMSQEELSMIIHYANRIKTVSATATFSVGQQVVVVQKTKRRDALARSNRFGFSSLLYAGGGIELWLPFSNGYRRHDLCAS